MWKCFIVSPTFEDILFPPRFQSTMATSAGVSASTVSDIVRVMKLHTRLLTYFRNWTIPNAVLYGVYADATWWPVSYWWYKSLQSQCAACCQHLTHERFKLQSETHSAPTTNHPINLLRRQVRHVVSLTGNIDMDPQSSLSNPSHPCIVHERLIHGVYK